MNAVRLHNEIRFAKPFSHHIIVHFVYTCRMKCDTKWGDTSRRQMFAWMFRWCDEWQNVCAARVCMWTVNDSRSTHVSSLLSNRRRFSSALDHFNAIRLVSSHDHYKYIFAPLNCNQCNSVGRQKSASLSCAITFLSAIDSSTCTYAYTHTHAHTHTSLERALTQLNGCSLCKQKTLSVSCYLFGTQFASALRLFATHHLRMVGTESAHK